MAWQCRTDIPIYTQLIAQIQQRIVSGALLPGERLPSVRDLAAEAGVNPNTMQRAMMEMEREELVYSQRTAGRFVTEDGERIRRPRESLARNQVKDFLEECTSWGSSWERSSHLYRRKEEGHHEHSGV
ncbi:MAG: GntR family transcriptional regulator [Evtepia gabavorous]